MQTAKIHIWLIGVALVAAPIFYAPSFFMASAFAQSGQQGNTVLQIQQLRAEIAELRDMIERQQYQIRRLQNQPAAASPSQASNAGGYVYNSGASGNNAASNVPSADQTYPTDTAPSSPSTSGDSYPVGSLPNVAASNSALPNSVPSYPPAVPRDSSRVSPAVANTQGGAQSQEQFYRPYAGDGELVDENPEVVSAARQARQANDVYPPVVDRSIGGSANTGGAPVSSVATGSAATGSITTDSVATGSASPGPNSNVSAPVVSAPTSATVIDASTISQPGVAEPATAVANPAVNPANRAAIITPGQVAAASTGTAAPASAGVIRIPSGSADNAPSPQISSPAPAPQAARLSEDVLYKQGFDLLKQFKYDDAVAVFKQQIDQYPSGGYADDAHYWVAESMYLNRNLGESKQYFRAIIDNFAQSPRVPDAMLKTAYIEQDQGNEIEARILLQEIIQYHPRSDAAISAKNRLEKLD